MSAQNATRRAAADHDGSFHCSSVIFLLHIALDIPVAIQGLWSPAGLPFMQLNNTTVVFIKVRADPLAF